MKKYWLKLTRAHAKAQDVIVHTKLQRPQKIIVFYMFYVDKRFRSLDYKPKTILTS